MPIAERALRGLPRAAPGTSKVMIVINLIIWLVVGVLVGLVASHRAGTETEQSLFLNAGVGAAGAAFAGLFIAPLVGADTLAEGGFSFGALIVALLGAILMLAIARLLREGATP
jgi:uncharacterized membrane protein YeaQ/YmgE (transglycosylase-associated protein family)